MNELKAVIFDIDGTLTEEVSWTGLTRAMGGSAERHMKIFHDYLNEVIDYPESKRQLLGLWQATGNANLSFMKQLFANWRLRQDSADTIDWLSQKGYEVGLITGSFNVYAEAVASQLAIGNYYANTELIFDSAGKLIDYHYYRDQAQKKLAQLHAFCDKFHIDAGACVAVGDADNDLDLFRTTGHGILLGDSTNAVLIKASWKRIRALSEIKALLTQF
jgi:HAD superfamily phosphoserine phosphatase-like hydrolase